MATQTEAQAQAEIRNRIAILQEIRKAAGVNSSGTLSNYVAREATALDDVPGDYTTQSDDRLKSIIRASLNAAMSPGAARAVLEPLFRNYANVITTIGEQAFTTIMARVFRYMHTTSKYVKARDLTFGSPAAGSNIGDGVINRLTVDAYGYDIEACTVEAKRADCMQDSANGGLIYEEKFLFRGAKANVDTLVISGSGKTKEISCRSVRSSLLQNASFDSLDGTSITALTSLPGWTVGAELIANYNLDRTNYYRSFSGADTPASVKFLNNGSLTQAFSVNNITFEEAAPYYLQIAYNRAVGSCDGRLWLSMGNASVSVLLTSQTGWNILRIPLTSILWPQNFAAGVVSQTVSPKAVIQLQSRTSGTLLVDDAILVKMVDFDGHWYMPMAGATGFVGAPLGAHDTFTWTDSLVGTDSILQHWFWRMGGFYLPYKKDGSQTWAEPSV